MVSDFFSVLSLCSWICAQLPQIFANYTSKSAEGISPSFLLLWFMGDFLSLTSCLLNDVVLKFQVYLSMFFICNDLTLCFQYYYYTSVYPKKHYLSVATSSEGTDPEDPESVVSDVDRHLTDSIQIRGAASRKDRPIVEYLSSSGSPDGSYNSTNDSGNSISPAKAFVLGTTLNAASTEALPVVIRSTIVATAATTTANSAQSLGLVLAWACTVVYVTSRCPQLYKNYKRKSVDGISPLLFGSALIGNLTYTLSILTSCNFLFGEDKWTFIMRELPYILGSSGTIVFDVAYFYQRYLYRNNGRNTLVMGMDDWDTIREDYM